jgi:hypothetical protein
MPHVIETATTGRAKCRGCGEKLAAGVLRFGERLPNPFGEGDTTHWFHLDCAAFKRPEPFLEALATSPEPPAGVADLEAEARRGVEHRRLPRIDGGGRAPTGRAACRHCREAIEKDAWRIALVYYEDGRFAPSGYVHARCAPGYFETADVLARVSRFSPALGDGELGQLRDELAAAGPS